MVTEVGAEVGAEVVAEVELSCGQRVVQDERERCRALPHIRFGLDQPHGDAVARRGAPVKVGPVKTGLVWTGGRSQ